jgi:hypothetical protein
MEDRAMRSPTRGRRPGRSTALLLVLTMLAALAAACGSSASAPFAGGGAAASAAPAAREPDNLNGTGGGQPAATSGTGGQVGTDGDQVAIIDDAKIVRTGSLQLTVTNVTTALTSARDKIRGLGGYIGGSQQERTGDSVVASVTYRIPVGHWEDALDAIRGPGHGSRREDRCDRGHRGARRPRGEDPEPPGQRGGAHRLRRGGTEGLGPARDPGRA